MNVYSNFFNESRCMCLVFLGQVKYNKTLSDVQTQMIPALNEDMQTEVFAPVKSMIAVPPGGFPTLYKQPHNSQHPKAQNKGGH